MDKSTSKDVILVMIVVSLFFENVNVVKKCLKTQNRFGYWSVKMKKLLVKYYAVIKHIIFIIIFTYFCIRTMF